MEQTLIGRKELAKRWGYPSTKPIEDLENRGILTRIQHFAGVRYNIKQVEEIENIGLDVNPLSPVERIRKDREIEQLKIENEKLKGIIANARGVLNV